MDTVDPDITEALAADAYESNDTPATAKTLNLPPWVPLKIEPLSLHSASDVDYFAVQFQADKSEGCSTTVKKFPTGAMVSAWNVRYIPGSLHIAVKDEYCRPLQLSVSDSAGAIWQSTTSSTGVTVDCP